MNRRFSDTPAQWWGDTPTESLSLQDRQRDRFSNYRQKYSKKSGRFCYFIAVTPSCHNCLSVKGCFLLI